MGVHGLSPGRMWRRGGHFLTPRICFFRAREESQKFENAARCEENIRESAENRGAQVSYALNSEEE